MRISKNASNFNMQSNAGEMPVQIWQHTGCSDVSSKRLTAWLKTPLFLFKGGGLK